jgi:transcriptional regulator with XRE-family HTH domain
VDSPSRSYAAHRFRSTLAQGVDRLMAAWCHEHRREELAGVSPSVFADCILDHTVRDLGYRDLRIDGHPTARYEQLVAAGVAAWFAELWGDGPNVRRGLDLDAIEHAHSQLRVVDARIGDLTTEVERLRREDLPLDPDSLSPEQAVAALLRIQTNANQRERLLEEREELRLKRARLERELAGHLKREVLLPVDACDEAYERRKTELLSMIEGNEAPQDDGLATLPLADELTVADVAELFGVTPQHVGRWRRGLSNPPLEPQVWRRVNGKDYRLPVSAFDAEALRRIPAPDPGAALDQIRRKRARDGFGRRALPHPSHA